MNLIDEYLDYLQDSNAPAGVFVALSLVYAAFKNWKSKQKIANAFCKKYKGDTTRTDICVAEKQIENARTLIKQLQGARHTCDDTRSPNRYSDFRWIARFCFPTIRISTKSELKSDKGS